MRVVYLAAGAAGMYCGSCLRDNRLAATLIEQGRDVVLVPLYTPLRTDEPDMSTGVVQFGGINVYLSQLFPPLGQLPRGIKRLLDSPGLISWAARLGGSTSAEDLGALAISVLRGEHGRQRAELQTMIDALRPLRTTIVHLATLLFLGMARSIKEALGVPVFCTLSGEDIFLDALPAPYREQAFRLIEQSARHVDAFVAVTQYYGRFATEHFQLPAERVFVTPMGVNVDRLTRREGPGPAAFTVGYMARICPEKGLMNLCEALAQMRRAGRDARVLAAGYLSKGDRPYLDRVSKFLHREGVHDRFTYLGEVDWAGKVNLLHSSSVLSVPTVYHEAKGLYVLEALACGVPVVQPRHGSFPELIDATNGGLLYDPADPGRLAAALSRLMDDPALRERLGRPGAEAVRQRFSNTVMAQTTWELYERVLSTPPH